MIKKIDEIMNDNSLDNLGKLDDIQYLIKNAKDKLETDVLLGTKDVNDIVNF